MPSFIRQLWKPWLGLIFWLTCLHTPWVSAETNLEAPQLSQTVNMDVKLLQWVRDNKSPSTNLPYSFDIPPGKKSEIYQHIGKTKSITGIIERLILEEGISIYDTAVWQITLTMIGGEYNLKLSSLPIEVYWRGSLKDLSSLWARIDDQRFSYQPDNPVPRPALPHQVDPRGFLFRIINANGHYRMTDPRDNKIFFETFPNSPHIHWEDWKPIAGENAWVVLAALHLYHNKNFLLESRTYDKSSEDSVELLLAQEIAQTAILLQSESGGIRMAPLGTYYHLKELDKGDSPEKISQELDDYAAQIYRGDPLPQAQIRTIGTKEFPEYHIWYYEEISTENNLSWYAAFRMLYQITRDPAYKDAMDRIEIYFKTVWNPRGNLFFQGMHKTKGVWHPNTEFFATDVQNWSIVVLGPKKLDEWFGEGAAYRIWQRTKVLSGCFNASGEILGIGYTHENNRISVEWTCGAIFATRLLADHYANSHPAWALQAKRDGQTMRKGIDVYRKEITGNKAAYSYSSRRDWIPFGWFSHEPDILSLVSTCWVLLVDANFNPFVLPQF